jgi:hypothetical protein
LRLEKLAVERNGNSRSLPGYVAEKLPKKRAGDMHWHNLPWWKKNIGHLKQWSWS